MSDKQHYLNLFASMQIPENLASKAADALARQDAGEVHATADTKATRSQGPARLTTFRGSFEPFFSELPELLDVDAAATANLVRRGCLQPMTTPDSGTSMI